MRWGGRIAWPGGGGGGKVGGIRKEWLPSGRRSANTEFDGSVVADPGC